MNRDVLPIHKVIREDRRCAEYNDRLQMWEASAAA